MKKTGFYIIKDIFFTDMPDPYLKGNKAGNRPYYYWSEDSDKGIFWMIPLSSRIDKYIKMLKRGVKFTPTQPDVLIILEKLKTNE